MKGWPIVVALVLLAGKARGDDELSFGGRPDTTITASLGLYVADVKKRSHFGFEEQGSRNGELNLVTDLGAPSTAFAGAIELGLHLGRFGFVGGEALVLPLLEHEGTLTRMRRANGLDLFPGDRLRSREAFVFGRLLYGFEIRYRLEVLEVALAPTLGGAVFDVDARPRRLSPVPSGTLGGHSTSFALTVGARLEVLVLGHLVVGAEAEHGLPIDVSTPETTLWERYRAFLGARFLFLEASVGYRLVAAHAEGAGKGVDVRLRGFDLTIGVAF